MAQDLFLKWLRALLDGLVTLPPLTRMTQVETISLYQAVEEGEEYSFH